MAEGRTAGRTRGVTTGPSVKWAHVNGGDAALPSGTRGGPSPLGLACARAVPRALGVLRGAPSPAWRGQEAPRSGCRVRCLQGDTWCLLRRGPAAEVEPGEGGGGLPETALVSCPVLRSFQAPSLLCSASSPSIAAAVPSACVGTAPQVLRSRTLPFGCFDRLGIMSTGGLGASAWCSVQCSVGSIGTRTWLVGGTLSRGGSGASPVCSAD